jgi:hypothetical protein
MNAATTAVTASPRERTAALRALALALGLTLVAAALSVPPLRSLIERSMVWHMVVQMPLLMLAGWLCAGAWSQKDIKSNSESTNESANQSPTTWNQFGLTGGLMALVVLAYWMLPSSIDRALVVPGTDALKLTSLWMCGALLRQSAFRAPLVLQLFFVGTALPMLMWAGLYFASTDLRLCNAYSLDSQIAAGRSLAALGAALGAWWTVRTAVRLRHVA